MGANPLMAVAIAREMGAGGAVLGQRLARRLRFAYLDRALLRLVAKRAGVTPAALAHWDEHVSHFWERMAEVLAVGPADALYTPAPLERGVRDRQLFHLESQVIREVASRRDLVVIGRGAFWVLRDHPGLVSVRLHAPLASRIPVVMQTHHLASADEARELIEHTDADRARFISEMTGRACESTGCYDLSINTCQVGLDLAEEFVARTVEQVRQRLVHAGA